VDSFSDVESDNPSSSLLPRRSSTVILLSLSREESNFVFVRDLPQVELSGVITPVFRPGSVTSTVPDGIPLVDMYRALFYKLPASRIDVMLVELCH